MVQQEFKGRRCDFQIAHSRSTEKMIRYIYSQRSQIEFFTAKEAIKDYADYADKQRKNLRNLYPEGAQSLIKIYISFRKTIDGPQSNF